MTLQEYASRVGYSTDTVRRWCKLGLLPFDGCLVGNGVRIISIPDWARPPEGREAAARRSRFSADAFTVPDIIPQDNEELINHYCARVRRNHRVSSEYHPQLGAGGSDKR